MSTSGHNLTSIEQKAWNKTKQRRKQIAAANDEPCWICQGPMNYRQQYNPRDPMAVTIDHLIPIHAGGPADPGLDGCAPAHKLCNEKRARQTNRPRNAADAIQAPELVWHIAGPPCAGKTTWALSRARKGIDTILDADHIADNNGRPRSSITAAEFTQAHQHQQHAMLNWTGPGTLYIIRTTAKPLHPDINVHLINPGKAECHNRAKQDKREQATHDWITRWYLKHSAAPITPTLGTTTQHATPLRKVKDPKTTQSDEGQGPGAFFVRDAGNLLAPNFLSSPTQNTGSPSVTPRSVTDGGEVASVGGESSLVVTEGRDSVVEGRGEGGTRFISPSHPDAVDTLGPAWGKWLADEGLMELKPWQQVAFDRCLEVDDAGDFVWQTVVISLMRQMGKTWMIRGLALCRAALMEGRQDVLLTADKAATAWDAMVEAFDWADDKGIHTIRSRGSEAMTWPDKSKWRVVSKLSVYGKSANMYLLDEAFAASVDLFESAIQPTMLARENPQAYVFSAANQDSTELMGQLRRRAMEGSRSTCLIEWGATTAEIESGGATDPRVWEVSLPPGELTKPRRRAMEDQCSSATFHVQQLNVHPEDLFAVKAAAAHWPAGFDGAVRVERAQPGGVGVVDNTADGTRWDAAVGFMDGTRVGVVSASFVSSVEAFDWLRGQGVSRVLMGKTHLGLVEPGFFGRAVVEAFGVREWADAIEPFVARVERGDLMHNFDDVVMEASGGAVPRMTELGLRLSTIRSLFDLNPLKVQQVAAWAAVQVQPTSVQPAIY